MVRTLLVRGMLVGVVAGLLTLIMAVIFGESQVVCAIELEEAGAAHSHDATVPAGEPEAELVSRGVQSTIGLATGLIVDGFRLA